MRGASPCKPVLFECSNGCSAVLSFSRQGENQYKAIIHVLKTEKRLFGTRRNTISEAVDHLFDKHKTFVSQKELHRVQAVVRASDPLRYGANHVCKTPPRKHAGPQPRSENNVQIYHQMYVFFFRDGKPMPPLFEASRSAWQAQAEKTGARYHLWNPAEVESLIKAMMPQFWGLYVNLRFPHIQRCDIGRLIILFCCGGMYVDLDVLPNRESYMQVEFAVCRIDRQDYRIEKERSPAKKK